MYMEGGHPGSPISPQAMMRPPYMPGMGSPEGMYLFFFFFLLRNFYAKPRYTGRSGSSDG